MFAGYLKRASLALVALSFGSLIGAQTASATGTAANTSITNRATVNYSVGGVAQSPIESSPTGNSNPGAGNGANTVFVVDNKIDLTVVELSGNATVTNPGATNVVTAFRVTNTGNNSQGYALTPTNETGTTVFGNVDNQNVANLRTFVDSNANSTYDPAIDTATNINTLAADANVVVFIVSDVPLTATNGQFANVQLSARAAVAGTSGATLVTETAGAENPAAVDIVFADAGRDATQTASDQYAIQSATLSVTKTLSVISDPFNNVTNPKAIPGAVVQYAIAIANTGAVSATGVAFSDPIPTNTTIATGGFGAGQDIQITPSSGPVTTCTAAVDADGCSVAAGTLSITSAAMPTIANGQSVTVRFRVTIN